MSSGDSCSPTHGCNPNEGYKGVQKLHKSNKVNEITSNNNKNDAEKLIYKVGQRSEILDSLQCRIWGKCC